MERGRSEAILAHNQQYIPGGVVSVNRAVPPTTVFVKGQGSRIVDADGNVYLDYHAAFAPYILGHCDPDVDGAVIAALQAGRSLMGMGPTEQEGVLAELVVQHVPGAELIQIGNSGSEATAHAVRIARAHTGRDDLLLMQGGYNGWHNDVACNVMTPLEAIGPRVSPGEYPVKPLSAGIPDSALRKLHVVNYNDLESVEYCCRRYPIGGLILEPILQNIGVVKPVDGYLQGLRDLADRYGFVLIFDEVKTGFRAALGGYQSVCGVTPDLCVFGKAVANGYPLSVIAGRRELMDYFVHPDATKRVLIAGTYNAHPVPVAAAIATIAKLAADDGAIYRKLEALGQRLESGLRSILEEAGRVVTLARQGSAFVVYFMDHAPVDWHDLASHHDFELDERYRRALLEEGIFNFPLPAKQGSISAAHTEADIDQTLEQTRRVVQAL